MDINKVSDFLASSGQPNYRLKQLLKNYYSGRYKNFLDMSDLPISLRQDLDLNFNYLSVRASQFYQSRESSKALLTLSDGLAIESVLMVYRDWTTACLSTQVGCPLKCSFCATGQMGLRRNLTTEEIIDQVLYWNSHLYPQYVGRLVFMGMGEPFLNWDNLIAALKVINQDLQIGARKISVSTAGIVPRIYDFADLNTEVNLAVSLHSLNQSTRQLIMPIAKTYPLPDLLKSFDYYTNKTSRQLFLEYALIDSVNDSQSDVDLLIKLLRSNNLLHLNLIPLNHVPGGLTPSRHLNEFHSRLIKAGINVTLRRSIGADISSACGQLAVKPQNTSKI